MSKPKICMGDLGTVIYVQITDELTGAAQDPTGVTVTATVSKPNGTSESITLATSTDTVTHPPASGWCQYAPVGDWFTVAGMWKIKPRYTVDGSHSWKSADGDEFWVYP